MRILHLIIAVSIVAAPFAASAQAAPSDEELNARLEAEANLKDFAGTVCAGKVVPINSISGGGVLYKPENIHGGRGPTFVVQNTAERTGKQVIEVRDARCNVVGSFGLYATDYPYGARYYTRTGGSGFDPDTLLPLLQAVGSNNFLVEGVNKWIRVKNPYDREGSVVK